MLREEEEEEIKNKRKKEIEECLQKNYSKTFIEPVEKAANRKYKSKNGISRIELIPLLNLIGQLNIYDEKGNKISNSEVENVIRKFWFQKKKANDKNSDRYFLERKSTNQKENLLNRSLGEETFFNY